MAFYFAVISVVHKCIGDNKLKKYLIATSKKTRKLQVKTLQVMAVWIHYLRRVKHNNNLNSLLAVGGVTLTAKVPGHFPLYMVI